MTQESVGPFLKYALFCRDTNETDDGELTLNGIVSRDSSRDAPSSESGMGGGHSFPTLDQDLPYTGPETWDTLGRHSIRRYSSWRGDFSCAVHRRRQNDRAQLETYPEPAYLSTNKVEYHIWLVYN